MGDYNHQGKNLVATDLIEQQRRIITNEINEFIEYWQLCLFRGKKEDYQEPQMQYQECIAFAKTLTILQIQKEVNIFDVIKEFEVHKCF